MLNNPFHSAQLRCLKSMFKDIEGYDCEYIKANKPEKCLKEHNGQKVGLVSCPQSCNMVEECLKEFGNNEVADSPAVQNVTSKVAVVDSDSLIAEDEQKDTLIDETNATSNAMANFTGTEDVDDESTSAGSIVGEEIHASSVSGGKTLASGDVDAGLSNAGNAYFPFSVSHNTIVSIYNSIYDIGHNSIHRYKWNNYCARRDFERAIQYNQYNWSGQISISRYL